MLNNNPHIYLISDSTGETVSIVARSVYARFENINFNESRWALTLMSVHFCCKYSSNFLFIIVYNIIPGLSLTNLIILSICLFVLIKAHPILDSTITALKKGFELKTENKQKPGKQHSLSDDYFERIEALQYAIANDDGQIMEQNEADIILFGVSRTSKTPTSIYLANKGIKVANIPFVLNQKPNLSTISKNTLVVGLFASPERLQQIRLSRLKSLKEKNKTKYVEMEFLKKEVKEAKTICIKNSWVTIDVTKKSIEEIAATVLEYYKIFKKKKYD